MIDISQHYEEQTPYILLDNVTPLMNSLPYDRAFLVNKRIMKVLKKHECNAEIQNLMNIAFTQPQLVEIGEIVEWSHSDLSMDVVVLSHDRAFIKGQFIWLVVVGIKE